MPQKPSETISKLLANWRARHGVALRSVTPLVYDELRQIVHHPLHKRPGHTLRSAALVYEACVRLEKQGAARFENHEHFLAIFAQLIRQILAEYARSPKAIKPNGGCGLTLDDNLASKAFDA